MLGLLLAIQELVPNCMDLEHMRRCRLHFLARD